MDMNDLLSDITRKHTNKKIIIFGAGAGGQTLYNSAQKAGFEVLYFIDNYKQGNYLLGRPIKSPYDIFYEDINDILILIGVCQDCDVMQIKNQLNELGLTEGINFETPLFNDLYAPLDYIDPMLGYNRNSDIMGFNIYGKDLVNAKKIIVLGGSTSDPSFGGYKSWPEYLHEEFAQNHIDATIYNGAVAGYYSAQEMLKVIRDCLTLIPDIIITFDGVNDAIQPMQTNHPIFHPYSKKTFDVMFNATVKNNINVNVNNEIKGVTYGYENNTSRLDFWYQNLRIIKSICEEFKISFLPFLQPTSLYKKSSTNDNDERSFAINSFYKEATALAEASGFIIDATSVLDGTSNSYADFVHYTESGNKHIAEFIFRYISKRL